MGGGITAQDYVLGALALAGVLLVVVLGVMGSRRRSAPTGSLRGWAAGRGWSYLPERDEVARHLPGVAFDLGEHRRCRNLVRGTVAGLSVTALDYSYLVPRFEPDGAPAGSTTFQLRVLLLELAQPWPRASALPQHLLDGLGTSLDGPAVQLGDPAFDRAYRVVAADAETTRRLLAPLAARLLARPDQGLEVDDTVLVLFRPGLLEAADLTAWLDDLAPALAGLPAAQAG